MLDVLGFRALLKGEGLHEVHEIYVNLMSYITTRGSTVIVHPEPGGVLDVYPWYFSDTMLFAAPYGQNTIGQFLDECAEIVCHCIESAIPVRGAIAVGEALPDYQAGEFLGVPLVEVAEAEEGSQWLGVSLGPSFEDPTLRGLLENEKVLRFSNHVKEGRESCFSGLVLDWPRHWRLSRDSDVIETLGLLDPSDKHRHYYDVTRELIAASASANPNPKNERPTRLAIHMTHGLLNEE
ncbi:MAG TPA: hypothetical protein VM118_01330 [Acidobacteriota bacterium]|nr:hypothetical protein [Acidobacteriota bacterium]